jgi:hypothetical protein
VSEMTAPTTASMASPREASAALVEMARGAKARGLRAIAATSVAQSLSAEPEPAARQRLLEVADLVRDACSPHADAMMTIAGLESPVGPGSTIGAVAIVNAITSRTAELLVEAGAMPRCSPGRARWEEIGLTCSSTRPSGTTRDGSRAIGRSTEE